MGKKGTGEKPETLFIRFKKKFHGEAKSAAEGGAPKKDELLD